MPRRGQRKHRWIKKQGVFAHQATTGPACADQQLEERIVSRTAGAQLDHWRIELTIQFHPQPQGQGIDRHAQARMIFRRGNLDPQRIQRFPARLQQGNGCIQGLTEEGLDPGIAKTEPGLRGLRQHHHSQRQQDDDRQPMADPGWHQTDKLR